MSSIKIIPEQPLYGKECICQFNALEQQGISC